MTKICEQMQAVFDEADCLHEAEAIEQALDKMAAEISAKIGHSNPLALCVMKGGLIPAGLLLPRLNFSLEIDYIHASRYADKTRGGELDWVIKPSAAIKGRVLLLIDDIHDEGLTMAAIVKACEDAGAGEVYSAALINKIHDRKNNTSADFIGLDVEDRYVFGCGMDYKGYWRNLPAVYAIKEDKEDEG